MISEEILVELTSIQIWKIQERVKKITYKGGDEVIIYYAPKSKSCFKDKYPNPRKLGARGVVVEDRLDSLLVEFKDMDKRINSIGKRVQIPKKYVIDIITWRDIQLDYLLK